MKNYTIFVALLLSACFGVSRQDFLQDTQNAEKSTELINKRNKSADCDKLATLDKFTKLKSPKSEDLSTIMPVFGLKNVDSTNIDKVFNLDYSKIDKLNCIDNAEQLMTERAQYCDNKYHNDNNYQQYCKYFLKQMVFENNANYADIDKQQLKQNINKQIHKIYSVPELDVMGAEYLSQEFTDIELIKANNVVLGKYDGDNCYSILGKTLCDSNTNNVTRLNAIMVVYGLCINNTFLLTPDDAVFCACYSHLTYTNVTYKNLIYMHEQNKMPQSKAKEFSKYFDKCEQKINSQLTSRYGEAGKKKYTATVFF